MNRRGALGFLAGFLALSATNCVANGNLKGKFKKGIKIGYLPICDHLLIIAKDIFTSPTHEIIGIKFASWADLAEALRAGAIDGAFLLAPLGLMLKASGVDIKVVMAAHKNGSALIANKNINSISDLNGKNVGIPSRFSSHYFILDKLTTKHGIRVNLVDMAPTEMPFALLTGRLDAYIVAEPFGQLAVKYGAKNLIFSKEITPNHICCLLNFSGELTRSSIAKELANAFKSAAKFATSSPNDAAVNGAKILGQELSIIDDTIQKGIISYNDLSVSKGELEELKQFLIRANLANDKLKNLDVSSYLESLI